tara:strand:- start:548 stop:1846 length:1299 start_codon:yes stop_codon:yes gene_type:complete
VKDLNFKKNINFETINSQIVYLFFVISSILLSIFFEPKLYPDSQSYIIMSPARSPGYPFFIFLNKTLFGDFFLKTTIFFQFLFWFYSSYFLISKISRFFKINLFSLLICFFILILPSLKFSDAILTESISFSFCLIILGLLIDLIFRENYKTLTLIILFFIVSCLLKPQLLFIFGLLIFVSIFLVFIGKIKQGLFITLLAFLSLVVIFNANKFYHLLNHNGFQIDTNLGSQLIAMPIFMTTKQEIENLNNKKNIKFLTSLYEELDKKKINFNYENNKETSRQYWIKVYFENYAKFVDTVNQKVNDFKIIENPNKFLFQLSVDLILLNLSIDAKGFLTGYFYNFSINGLYSLYLAFSFLIITLFVSVFSIYLKNKEMMIVSIFFVSHLSNVLVVSTIEPVINRYKFLTEIPLIVLIIILILNLVFSKTQSNDL